MDLIHSHSPPIWSGHRTVFLVERAGTVFFDCKRWDWPGTVFFLNPVPFIWMGWDKSKTQSRSCLIQIMHIITGLDAYRQDFGWQNLSDFCTLLQH